MSWRGATWPLENNAAGLVATSEELDILARSWMRQYLLCRRGARPKVALWGAGIGDNKFDPQSAAGHQLISIRCYEAEKVLPVKVDDVQVSKDPNQADTTWISVAFHVLGDAATQQTVSVPLES